MSSKEFQVRHGLRAGSRQVIDKFGNWIGRQIPVSKIVGSPFTSGGSPTDQLHVVGGDGITVTYGSPEVTVAVDGTVVRDGDNISVLVNDANYLKTIGSPFLDIRSGTGISVTFGSPRVTITNTDPNVDQNLWLNIAGDVGGPVAANTTTDTLTIAGGSRIRTNISGDTVTINMVGSPFTSSSGAIGSPLLDIRGGDGIDVTFGSPKVTIAVDSTVARLGPGSPPNGSPSQIWQKPNTFLNDTTFEVNPTTVDGTGVKRPVGLGVFPPYEIDTSATLDTAHASMVWHVDAGSPAVTFTAPNDSTIEIGSMWQVQNDDVENVTIAAGSPSVTILRLGAGGAPVAGNVLVQQGGIISVYKYTNTEYWVYGDSEAIGFGSPISADLKGLVDVSITGGAGSPKLPVIGDTLYYDGTNWVNLARGTAGQVLNMGSPLLPSWKTLDVSDLTGSPVALPNIVGGTSITVTTGSPQFTITNDDPNVDQNIWLNIASDVGGPVAANTTTDTLTIAGGTNVRTNISGDTVTVNMTGSPFASSGVTNVVGGDGIDVTTGSPQVTVAVDSTVLRTTDVNTGSPIPVGSPWSAIGSPNQHLTRLEDIPYHYGEVYRYDSTITQADPGTGSIRLNNATPGSATEIYISTVTAKGREVSGRLGIIAEPSPNQHQGHVITITDVNDSSNYHQWYINIGNDNTSWFELQFLTSIGGTGSFTNGTFVQVTLGHLSSGIEFDGKTKALAFEDGLQILSDDGNSDSNSQSAHIKFTNRSLSLMGGIGFGSSTFGSSARKMRIRSQVRNNSWQADPGGIIFEASNSSGTEYPFMDIVPTDTTETNTPPAGINFYDGLGTTETSIVARTIRRALGGVQIVTDISGSPLIFSRVLTIADSLNDLGDVVAGSPTIGAILYNDGTNWLKLARGTNGQVLTMGSPLLPSWKASVGGSPHVVPDPLLLSLGTNSDPTYSFRDDPDTGIYNGFANTISVACNGVRSWTFQEDRFHSNAGNAAMLMGQAATSTNPTLIPHLGDESTGIGAAATGTVSIIANSIQTMRFDEASGTVTNESFGKIIAPAATLSTPAFTFTNDENTGLHSTGPDSLTLVVGGSGTEGEAIRVTRAGSPLGILIANEAAVDLTADVGSAQGNGVITSSFNVYSTVGTTGDAATLPATFIVGTRVHVKNDGANSMDVFPASGDDAGVGSPGINIAVAVPAGESVIFIGTVANARWTQLIEFAAAGDPDQNLWLNIASDVGGPVAANTTTDTLTIAGGTNVRTNISGDTVTVNMTGSPFIIGSPTSASTFTVADESTDTTTFPVFVTAATGDLQPKTGSNLTFNSNTGDLSATLIAGIANANLVDKTDTETISGIYTFTAASGVTISHASATIAIQETGATADEGNWLIRANGDLFRIQTADDASPNSGVQNAMQVARTGTVVDSVSFDATQVIVTDGGLFRIENTGSNDFADFSHDGTDFITAFTNTDDWNIDGLSRNINFGSPVSLQIPGSPTFGTGAKVQDGLGNLQPVGFNTMPVYEIDAADTFDLAHAGMIWHKDSGGAVTFTCDDDASIPQGATWVVHNDDTEDVTIAQGSGVTIEFLAGGAEPVAGNVTVEQGGIVTVYKYTDTTFWVWGSKEAAAGGAGTVTSVGLTAGTLVDISGTNPITTSGTMTIDVDLSESAEAVYAPGTDYVLFLDGGVSGTAAKESGADFASVIAGVGLSAASGVLAFAGSELTDMTAAVVGSTDELILLDSGLSRRKQIDEINLGQFNNDQGWTSNAGTITGSGGNGQIAVFSGASSIDSSAVFVTNDTQLTLVSAAPFMRFNETGLSVGSPIYWVGADGGNLSIRLNNIAPYAYIVGTNASNAAITSQTWNGADDWVASFASGAQIRILDTSESDYINIRHDGTDVNFTHVNTTDWNITGITAINAGTVDADFDAITATSYGGITEANLVDKTAAEDISAIWSWTGSGQINLDDNVEFRIGTGNDITMLWDATDLEITGAAGSQVWNFRDGPHLTIYDDTDTDSVVIHHDGTDFNILGAGTNTTDLNISVDTAINFQDAGGTQIIFDMANDVSTFTGVIELIEQADHATSPTSGRGQVWVKSGSLGGELMYTEGDQDNDFTAYNVIEATYHFDQTITAADPGAGNMRWNNATPASVTNVYIDDTDETGRDNQFMLGNLADNDVLTMRSMWDGTEYLVCAVNGTPTDNTGWWTIPVTIVHSSTLPATGDPMHITVDWLSQAPAGAGGSPTSASSFTVTDESTDTTTFPVFVTAATGDLQPKTGSNLAFNSNTGVLTTEGLFLADSDTITFGTGSDLNMTYDGGAFNIDFPATNGFLNFTNWSFIDVHDGGHIRFYDGTDAASVQFSMSSTTELFLEGSGSQFLVMDGVHQRFRDNNDLSFGASDDIVISWDAVDLEITSLAANPTWNFRDGHHLALWDSTDTDNVDFHHDGTDFNIAGTTTTDINITGITAIAAGTVDADFDAITATSYGGITEANLVDKTATEAITGTWTLDGAITTSDFGTGGRVKDGTDVERPVGFNTIPVYEIDVADTFDLAHNGMMWHKDAGGTISFTCNNDTTIPTGASYLVHNDDTEDLTIAEGTATIEFLAPGAAPVGGDVTVEQGGIVTVYKYTDAIFWVWGAKAAATAGNITIADESADTTCFPTFVTAATGDLPLKSGTNLTFNSSTGDLSATLIAGIANGNLVDKSAVETIAGAWTFTGENTVTSAGFTFNDNIHTHFGTGEDVDMYFSGTDFFIDMINSADFRLRGGAASDPMISAFDDGPVWLYNNAVLQIQTQDDTASANTSGATVRAHAGFADYDIGFNVLPVFNDNVSDTLEAGHCGKVAFKDATTARTLTLEASGASDFPIGGMTTVINAFTATDYTITEGATTTLYYLDGTTRVDTAGGCTLGPGGVANVWREAAAVYYIWGTGITA